MCLTLTCALVIYYKTLRLRQVIDTAHVTTSITLNKPNHISCDCPQALTPVIRFICRYTWTPKFLNLLIAPRRNPGRSHATQSQTEMDIRYCFIWQVANLQKPRLAPPFTTFLTLFIVFTFYWKMKFFPRMLNLMLKCKNNTYWAYLKYTQFSSAMKTERAHRSQWITSHISRTCATPVRPRVPIHNISHFYLFIWRPVQHSFIKKWPMSILKRSSNESLVQSKELKPR